MFGLALADEAAVRRFLATQGEPRERIRSAADHLVAHVGTVLTDLRASGRFGGSRLTIDRLTADAGRG